jgi:hypothetical protein
MRMFRRVLGITLSIACLTTPALAQQKHVIDGTALDRAVQQRVRQDQADRDAIKGFLRDPAVQRVAAKAGLSVAAAEGAVSTLQGDELHSAASQARAIDRDLAGGDTVVITTTTLLIVVLLVLLIIAASH